MKRRRRSFSSGLTAAAVSINIQTKEEAMFLEINREDFQSFAFTADLDDVVQCFTSIAFYRADSSEDRYSAHLEFQYSDGASPDELMAVWNSLGCLCDYFAVCGKTSAFFDHSAGSGVSAYRLVVKPLSEVEINEIFGRVRRIEGTPVYVRLDDPRKTSVVPRRVDA